MTMAAFEDAPSDVEALFRQHNSWLKRWLRRKSRTISSEDVASEVFLRLLLLPGVANLREPRAMMATMASRVIYEIRRRNELWHAFEADLIAVPQALAPSPEEHAIVMEALRSIDKVLQSLSPKARAAFLYSRVDGMRQQEIATRLGTSVRTVERYLAEGMRVALSLQFSGQ
ncbi:MAG: sigma-70 family RNA polymerase sigma factor [Beijerinckiaceae bacterium]|nr:sigma-70 family RNA polymerase sigma factor [Beijerinckiaceae bacterium]